jgi:hypothetical protein
MAGGMSRRWSPKEIARGSSLRRWWPEGGRGRRRRKGKGNRKREEEKQEVEERKREEGRWWCTRRFSIDSICGGGILFP